VTVARVGPKAGVALIVDDEPLVLRSLKRALDGSFDVVAYESAAEAVEHVRRGGVSVVLSDIAMPAMTGLELLREVRRCDPDLPVLLVTGFPAVESATKAIEYGVFRYLQKPFEPKMLRETVEQAARLYRLARMKREALELVDGAGTSDRVGLEVSFRHALESLWIAFQPIVSASGRAVIGYEALLRSDAAALPAPSHVLEAAERLDALQELGRLVRLRAVEPIRETNEELLLFVNLHPRDLMDPELIDPRSPLAAIAHRVVLEITERASLSGLDNLQRTVATLRALGFRIAIDDLGAGYAGLTSFALLEPEIVKIDMTLTRGIDRSPVKQKLVGSMSALCREMGMTIVTEGVETADERDMLVALGCDLLQGYLYARPGRAFPQPTW
jgi:EAL domain-containing protein (putative c-di-GMP-specific phosphodiesterase class I)